MKFLQAFVETPLAGAVGWTLLHSLWEGALASAVLATVLLTMRSSRLRYAAACMAMVLMLGAFGVTLVRMLPGQLDAGRTFGAPAPLASNTRAVADAPGISDSMLAALAPWLAPLWMAGVLVFYVRHAAGFITVHRLRRRGVCCAPARWQQELARLSTRLRVSRPVTLLESSLADTPMVLGHLRPLILMPVGLLAGLPAAQIEAILLHELAHVRRHDYLVNVLQRLFEGLLFYHPAVWWICSVIRTERENCCDDVVVSIVGDAHEYAVALAALEQNRWSARKPAIAATGGSIVSRVRRLLYPRKPNGAWTPFLAAVILIAAAAMALSAWQSPPAHSPYYKWLHEDVAYIISNDERDAFEKLTTDEERNKFIEQFWLRRDPTPGTPVNEFKEEHYRRIAYANEHFAAGAPGWQTDRGRMYIIYGPPDEIESHPHSAASKDPYEVWLYRYIAGLGKDVFMTFVDRTAHGDFRIVPGTATKK